MISSTPSVEYTAKTLLKLRDMWEEYLQKGLVAEELNLAHESMVNSYPFQFDSAAKRLMEKLHSELYGVPVPSPDEYADIIQGVSNRDLKKALAAHHSPNGWIITLVADENVIKKQLDEAQKGIPASRRIAVTKVIQPDSLIQ